MAPETQWHRMSSELTREACKSFRRCLDISWYALLVQRPRAWIRWSGMPLHGATMAAPMRKLWLEKFPSIPAVEKICSSQSVRIERDRGWSLASRNKGQGYLLTMRGKSAMPESRREVPFPDQYGCDNPYKMDPFLKLLFKHGDRLATGEIHCDVHHQ